MIARRRMESASVDAAEAVTHVQNEEINEKTSSDMSGTLPVNGSELAAAPAPALATQPESSSSTVEQQGQTEKSDGDGDDSDSSASRKRKADEEAHARLCGICNKNEGKYKCPRCSLR